MSQSRYGQKIPPGMCLAHRGQWLGYRNLTYSPWHPCEWPGLAVILDSRTSHAARAADWDRKSIEQMRLTADICLRGVCAVGAGEQDEVNR